MKNETNGGWLSLMCTSEGFEITQEQADLLGNIHLKKIDISDEIFVINVDGYIGNTTRKEIEYAKKKGKAIREYSDGEIPSEYSATGKQ